MIGFFACTAHVVDIGGRGFGADGKSVFEEGLQIPIMKFVTPIVLAPVLLISIASLPFITGCGSPATSSVEATPVASIDKSLYTLEEEPEGALGVIEARESAADGAPVIIVGRIGGAVNPWVEGRAAFTLLDASISVVAEGEDAEVIGFYVGADTV